MKKLIIILVFISTNCLALVTEFSGDFGYQKQVYGNNRENSVVTMTTRGSIAFYFWNNTALEINYSKSNELRTDYSSYTLTASSIKINKTVDTTNTHVYGIGLRQALAGKNATIRPTVSLGYARQFDSSYRTLDYTDTSTSQEYNLRIDNAKNEVNSIFATVSLQFKLTRFLSFRTSVNTVFEAFKFNKAKDYLKYSAGFTWYF